MPLLCLVFFFETKAAHSACVLVGKMSECGVGKIGVKTRPCNSQQRKSQVAAMRLRALIFLLAFFYAKFCIISAVTDPHDGIL